MLPGTLGDQPAAARIAFRVPSTPAHAHGLTTFLFWKPLNQLQFVGLNAVTRIPRVSRKIPMAPPTLPGAPSSSLVQARLRRPAAAPVCLVYELANRAPGTEPMRPAACGRPNKSRQAPPLPALVASKSRSRSVLATTRPPLAAAATRSLSTPAQRESSSSRDPAAYTCMDCHVPLEHGKKLRWPQCMKCFHTKCVERLGTDCLVRHPPLAARSDPRCSSLPRPLSPSEVPILLQFD